jgi:hypothetical protein
MVISLGRGDNPAIFLLAGSVRKLANPGKWLDFGIVQ